MRPAAARITSRSEGVALAPNCGPIADASRLMYATAPEVRRAMSRSTNSVDP